MIYQYTCVLVLYILFGAVQNAVIEGSQQSNVNELLVNVSASDISEINDSPSIASNDSLNIKSSIDLLLKTMNRKISKETMNEIQNNYNDLLKKSKHIIDDKKKLKRIKKLKADDDNDESNNSREINTDNAVDETLADYGSGLKRKRPPLIGMEKDLYEIEQPKYTKTLRRGEKPKYTKKAKSFYASDSNADSDDGTYVDRKKYHENKKQNIDIDISETDYGSDVTKKAIVKFNSMKSKYDNGEQESKAFEPVRNKIFYKSDIDSTTQSNVITTKEEIIERYLKKPWYIKWNPIGTKVDHTSVAKRTTHDVFVDRTDALYRDYDHFLNEVVLSSTTRKIKIDEPIQSQLTVDVTEMNENQSEITPGLSKSIKHSGDYDVDDITDRSLDIYKTTEFKNYGSATALEEDTVTGSLRTENKENIFRHYKRTRQRNVRKKHPVDKHKNHKQTFNFDTFSKKSHRMKYLLDKVTPDISFEVIEATDPGEKAYNATRSMEQRKNYMLHLETTKKYNVNDDPIQDDNRYLIETNFKKSKTISDKKMVTSKRIKPVTVSGSLPISVSPKTQAHIIKKNMSTQKHLSKIITKPKASKIQKAMEKTVIDNVLAKYDKQEITTLNTEVDIDAKMYEKVMGITTQKSTTIADLAVLNYTPKIFNNKFTKVVNHKNELSTDFITSIAPTHTTLDQQLSTTTKLTRENYLTLLTKDKSTTRSTLKKVISVDITPVHKKQDTEISTEYSLNITLPVNFKLLDVGNRSTHLPWYKKHNNLTSTYRTILHRTQKEEKLITSVEQVVHQNNVDNVTKTQASKNETVLNASGGGGNDDNYYDDEEDVFENEPIYTPDLFNHIPNEIKNISMTDKTVKEKQIKTPVMGLSGAPVKRYKTKSMTKMLLQALLKLNNISQSDVTPSPSNISDRNIYSNTIFSVFKDLIRITLEVLLDKSPMTNNRTWYTIIDDDNISINNDTSADESDADITDLIFSESFLKGVFSQGNMYAGDGVTTTAKYSYLNSNLGENSDDETNSDPNDSNTFENEPIFTDQEMYEYRSKAKSFVETILEFILNKSVNATPNKTSFLGENRLKSVSPVYNNIVNTVVNIFNNKTKNGAFYGNRTTSTIYRNKDKNPAVATTQVKKHHENNVTSLNLNVIQEVLPLVKNATATRIAGVSTLIPKHMQKPIIAHNKNTKQPIINILPVDNRHADFYESTTNTTETVVIVTVSNTDLIALQSNKANVHKTSATEKLETYDRTVTSKKPCEYKVTSRSVAVLDTRTPTFVKSTYKTQIIENHTQETHQSNNSINDNLQEKNTDHKTEFASELDAGRFKAEPKGYINIFTQPMEQIYEDIGKKIIDYEDYEEVTTNIQLPYITDNENTDKENDIINNNTNLTGKKANGKPGDSIFPFTENNKNTNLNTMRTSVLSKAVTESYVKETLTNNIVVSTDKKYSPRLSSATGATMPTVHDSTNLNVLSTAVVNKLSKQNRTKWISDEWIFEETDKKISTKSKIFPKTAVKETSINVMNKTSKLQSLEETVLKNRLSLMDVIDDLDKLNAALILYNKELMATVVPIAKGVTPHETSPHTLIDVKTEDLEEMLYYEMPVKKKEVDDKISSTPIIFFNETSILTKDTLDTVITELEIMNDLAKVHNTESDLNVNKPVPYPAKVNPLDPNVADVLRKMILNSKTSELSPKIPEKVSSSDASNELYPKLISIDDKNLETILQKVLLHYTLAKSETTTEMFKIVKPLKQNMTHQVPIQLYNWETIVNSVLENTRKYQEKTCPTVHCFVINSSDKTKPRITALKLPEDQETLYPITSHLNDTEWNKKNNDRKNFPNTKVNVGDSDDKLPPPKHIANVVEQNDINKLNQSHKYALKPLKSFFYKKPSVETFIPNTNSNLKPVLQPVAPSYVSPINTCGLDNAPSRNIKEGEDNIETYPWLGVLMYPKGEKRLVTTVILVTVQLVIASAWEINKLPKEDFRYCAKVILGQNCTGPRIGVVSYNYHPDFRVGFYSALAIIQIDTTNVISKLQPICPPPQLMIQPQYYAIVMPEDCISSTVNIFKMEHVPIDLCKQYYRRSKLDTSRFWPRHSMCGKARRGGVCRWRAGTALVARQDQRWHLLGFSVSGPGCEAPARFLDYGMHTRWVELTVERIGQPAITRIAPNKLVFRRSVNQIQRFGPCDKEELHTSIFRDSTDVPKPPGTKRETSRVYYNLTILKNMDYQCLIFQAENVGDKWLPLPKLDIRKNKIRSLPTGGMPATLDFNITIEYYDDIQYQVQAFGLNPDGISSKTSKYDLIKEDNNIMKKIQAKYNDFIKLADSEKNEYFEGGEKMRFWNEKTVHADDENNLKLIWDEKRNPDADSAKNDNDDKSKYTEKDEIKPVWEINGRRYIRRKSLEKYKNSYTHNFHSKTAMRSSRKTVENSNRRLAKARGRRRQKKRSNDMKSKSTKHKTRGK